MLLALGFTALEMPKASAACPIEGCNFPDPTPPAPKPQPPLRDAYFTIEDQSQAQFRIIYLTMNYPSVNSQGQNTMLSRIAYATNEVAPTSPNYFLTWANYAKFKAVRIDTSRVTTFTAYGQYSNGVYGYKTANIRYSVSPPVFNNCYKWFIWADGSTMQAQGFYPNSICS